MSTTLRHMAIRPLIGVLAALVLASSATVAVAAETHAAKPLPTILEFVNGSTECLGGAPSARFETKHGKGKWVHVSTWTIEDGVKWDNPTPADTAKFERLEQFPLSGVPSTKSVKFEAFLVDRKGNKLHDDGVMSDPVTCS